MKSKTSYCNIGIIRKDITRYFPIWGLYSIGLVLYFILLYGRSNFMGIVEASIPAVSVLLFAGGFIVSDALFGYLYNTREAYTLHSMPVRRESWFLSHLISGILFTAVPNAVLVLIAECTMPHIDLGEALLMYLHVELVFIFFYAVGIFSAFCAGNRLGHGVTYAILNFASVLLYMLLETVYVPELCGVEISFLPYQKKSPFLRLLVQTYEQNQEYIKILSLIAVLAIAAAFFMYRRRRIESAGEFIAVEWMKPIFLVIYTLIIGVCVVYRFMDAFMSIEGAGRILIMLLGLLVGYLTGWMLLKKQVNIFSSRIIAGGAVLCAVFAASLWITKADPAGIVTYVPEAEAIESLYVRVGGVGDHTILPEHYEEFIKLHRDIAETYKDDQVEAGQYYGTYINFEYKTKGGRVIERSYNLIMTEAEQEKIKEQVQDIFSDPRYLLGYTDWEQYVNEVKFVNLYDGMDDIDSYYLQMNQIPAFLEALKQDCEEGRVITEYYDDQMYIIYIERAGVKTYSELYLDPDGSHAMEYLKQQGIDLKNSGSAGDSVPMPAKTEQSE